MSPDLFGNPDSIPTGTGGSLGNTRGERAPLAVRMRPENLEELVGQQHLLGPGAPLRRLVAGQPMSVFLWGPPGVGKTTLASIVSNASGARFVELSAVTAGVRELRAELDAAKRELERGVSTVLFIDEVHRFSKTQQDALLPAGGEPDRHTDCRNHGEPQFFRDLPTAVAFAAAAPQTPDRR